MLNNIKMLKEHIDIKLTSVNDSYHYQNFTKFKPGQVSVAIGRRPSATSTRSQRLLGHPSLLLTN